MLSPEQTSPSGSSPSASSSRGPPKSGRILACVLCQQRKIKCDRKFPCNNCTKSHAQCVPGHVAQRQRRRRFPERELLDRLRHYEKLLRQNGIPFEPMHPDHAPSEVSNAERDDEEGVAKSGDSRRTISKTTYVPRSIWQAMNQRGPKDDPFNVDEDDASSDSSPDQIKEYAVKKAWDQLYDGNDNILFASRNPNIQLSDLHPDQVQIFRLWQIYLDNVNPILKVTHTPSLQARIIDAAGSVSNIPTTLEALMFSIYSVAVISLTNTECQTSFGSTKEELLASYQLGCREALLKSGVLQSNDRDCLTALFLYLVSVRVKAHPRSLSSMFGIAMRIAQRMGIHNEDTNVKWPPLEAEMRRRLWWSLVIYDARLADFADARSSLLIPTWSCKTPLNVNDFDLRTEMKSLPAAHVMPTEGLFTVVRTLLSDYVRHSPTHLDFVNPVLKGLAKELRETTSRVATDLSTLEQTIEDKYLRFCNPENPLHFVTMWFARSFIAKGRLIEYYSQTASLKGEQNDTQRNAATSWALTMLQCDTNLMRSPLTKGYTWFMHFHFQFPAYIHIVQDLRRHPVGEQADRAWSVMSDNYDVRFSGVDDEDMLFFKICTRSILGAWDLREKAKGRVDEQVPGIVADMRRKRDQFAAKLSNTAPKDANPEAQRLDSRDQAPSGPLPNLTGAIPGFDFDFNGMPDMSGQQPFDFMSSGMNPMDWMSMDWNNFQGSGW